MFLFILAASKCKVFTLFLFNSTITPQYAIDLEKRKSNVNNFIFLVHCCFCIFLDVAAGKCKVFTLFSFFSTVTPQYAIDLEKRKSNVNNFILLVHCCFCIFFDVAAGKYKVFILLSFLFYSGVEIGYE